ncbi:hypothetical protein NE865_10175 [Phthorimaea operculella]|nr:hypothetical protein NE865_10175 [Phthorimaea operculella]
MSQISDFFKRKSVEEARSQHSLALSPLTKESKTRRHIRSMSDVHCSTPYRIPFRSRKGSTMTLMYDSDTRAKRIGAYRGRFESSDSSDYTESPIKLKSLEQNILKHTDSMRVL